MLASRPPDSRYIIFYGAQVATRFVLIQDPATIPGVSELNPLTQTRTLQMEVLRARPLSYSGSPMASAVIQTVTVILPPKGSCTTPSVNPSTVNFGMIEPSVIANPGDAEARRDIS